MKLDHVGRFDRGLIRAKVRARATYPMDWMRPYAGGVVQLVVR